MRELDVIIPWSYDPDRLDAFDKVLDHLSAWDWKLAVDGGDPFSRGRAINNAIEASDARVILINDADCIVPEEQIVRAVALALELPGPVFAFTDYTRLGPDGAPEMTLIGPPSQSCMAIRRADFIEAGGYDPRFEGWGYEDVAFNVACSRRWPMRRIPGSLFHLWHGDRRPDDSPLSCDPGLTARNLALLDAEYRR